MASLSIAVSSSQVCVGENFMATIILTGGTPWTVQDGTAAGPFQVVSPAFITNQTILNGNTAILYGQAPNLPGNLVITDTTNVGLRVSFPVIAYPVRRRGGTSIYVGLNGVPDVARPVLTTSDTTGGYGSVVYLYQVIAHANGGTTAGRLGKLSTLYNDVPYSANFSTGSVVTPLFGTEFTAGPGIAIIQNVIDGGPIPTDGNEITVTWSAVLGVPDTTYDVLRMQLFGDDAPVWQSICLGTTNTYYVDDGSGTLGSYVVPAVNTTSTANDSNSGLTPLEAKYTLGAARALAAGMAADGVNCQIVVSGRVAVSGDVAPVANLPHYGASGDNTVDALVSYNTSGSGSNVAIALGSGCDYVNLGFETDTFNQVLVGTDSGDTIVTDTRFFGCRVEGCTNAFRVAVSGTVIKAYDCSFRSFHGTCGMLANCCLYFSRCAFSATGSAQLAGAGTLTLQWNAGHACFRDCNLEAKTDSQNPVIEIAGGLSWVGAAVFSVGPTAPRSLTMFNCRLFGSTMDMSLFGVLNGSGNNNTTGVWFFNTPLGGQKNGAAIATLGPIFTSGGQGTYQVDPSVVAANQAITPAAF